MREIKFRIIHKEHTYYWGYRKGGFSSLPTSSNTMSMELAKKLSCQYTGLKDKNGKEIYEGDIVKKEMWENIFVVKWDDRKTAFRLINEEGFHNLYLDCLIILGNIYENPELLTPKYKE